MGFKGFKAGRAFEMTASSKAVVVAADVSKRWWYSAGFSGEGRNIGGFSSGGFSGVEYDSGGFIGSFHLDFVCPPTLFDRNKCQRKKI